LPNWQEEQAEEVNRMVITITKVETIEATFPHDDPAALGM